jgi:hypothetical protein
LVFSLNQCVKKGTTPSVSKVLENKLMTHKEAVDSLMIDSAAPRKPLIIKELKGRDGISILAQSNLSKLILNEYPINGFYGEDRYRIEFIVDDVKRDSMDARIYYLKGRNRHKKVITKFEGTLTLTGVSELIDPNIDTAALTDLYYIKSYSAKGDFQLKEDTTMLATSGLFKGSVNIDFVTTINGSVDLWYFSPETPSKGGGVTYEGTWTSYQKDKPTPKPVIWSNDLFQFANTILKEFSIGEREVEINEKYRHLGWENFWENEEWWNPSAREEKPKM